jgi:glycosyltransferase involved in cell wall biosynthesis
VNLLLVNHYAGGPAYGMEYRGHYLAREWVRLGHRVTIVGASQSHVRATQPRLQGRFTRETVEGVDYVWCATPAYRGNGVGRVLNILVFLHRLGQWRQWLREPPDVVIASSTYPADIGPARRIARRHGATLVWEVHDLWPLSPIELGGMPRWHPFILWMQWAEDAACRDADLVVSMLPMAARHLQAHGMREDKFVYVPNGVDPDEWSGAPADLPFEHADVLARARVEGRMVVAYAGAHGLANALDTLLDAAALLRDAPVAFVLVGTGPEKDALARRVAQQDLRQVHLLGPVSKQAIPALLAAMDVLYIGLKRQPLFRFGISPNKLMDYMMAARPVLCAIEAGNDLVAEAGCGFTVEPENAEALAQAVRRMLALPADERLRLGTAGRAWVQARHVYPVLARRFLQAVSDAEAGAT